MIRTLAAITPSPGRRLAVTLGALAAAALACAGVGGLTERARAADPGNPCPVGAPLRSYQVDAINVTVPLNRMGDFDPVGKMYALRSQVGAIRDEEGTRRVTPGLRDDPIQPLVIRANLGDCLEVSFTNQLGIDVGMHIDGLAAAAGSSGDAIGTNPSSSAPPGSSTVYRYFVPNDALLEGAHYIRPGPGNRDAVSHGLFGALVVEPAGSTYTSDDDGSPLASGWEATIAPPNGRAFRESVLILHSVGDESYTISTDSRTIPNPVGAPNVATPITALPDTDVHTGGTRPSARAINYRTEPYMHRLDVNNDLQAFAENSYTFGDPSTPMPRGYLGDPTRIRLLNGGSEVFNSFHIDGVRWRASPRSDPSWDPNASGLTKSPQLQTSSRRTDTQSIGPGESFNVEIEGGAGGTQQVAGDYAYDSQSPANHDAGMWGLWRVYDTLQPSFAALPDRAPPPSPVTSAGLIGRTMPDGTTITAANLAQWISPQLPPQGVRSTDPLNPDVRALDRSVMDWTVDNSNPAGPVYLGEPEDRGVNVSAAFPGTFPNLGRTDDPPSRFPPGHPGLLPGDIPVTILATTRPAILFNPTTGRPAFPLLRPQIGLGAPYPPNGHSGAPTVGERADKPASGVDPYAGRPDGICPGGAPPRQFNLVAIQLTIQRTRLGQTDPNGKIFAVAGETAAIRAGQKPAEPLTIRANAGDCVGLTLTSEQVAEPQQLFPMTGLGAQDTQLDPSGSDGASGGLSYGQAVRPYQLNDAQLQFPVGAGAASITLNATGRLHPGIWIAVGEGQENIEVARIAPGANPAFPGGVVPLVSGLRFAHAAGEWAGTEFARATWYPDALLDGVVFRDTGDRLHNWGHGLIGQLVIEPPGSTYFDPATGAPVTSGSIVDVRNSDPSATLAPGVPAHFREASLMMLDGGTTTPPSVNLHAEPWADRLQPPLTDPSLLFSSYAHGDPFTPLPRAYVGDTVVLRTVDAAGVGDSFHLDGRVAVEARDGRASPASAVLQGAGEASTLILLGGRNAVLGRPGDYLYNAGTARRFINGAWGIIRILGTQTGDLQLLPGSPTPGGGQQLPQPTGGRPPDAVDPGDPCPAGAPQRAFHVSAVDVPGGLGGRTAAFVPTAQADAVIAGQPVEPLVLHAAAGDCITVTFTNRRGVPASFHVDKLLRDPRSSGVNVGFDTEQTVGTGASRVYRYFADQDNLGAAPIQDFGGSNTGADGLYGAIVVAPTGAVFTNPFTGAPLDVGGQVDVNIPGRDGYRDFTVLFGENDPLIGADQAPFNQPVTGNAFTNLRQVSRVDDAGGFSSIVNGGDPGSPLLSAYTGDPMVFHAIGGAGDQQLHSLSLGGLSWPRDASITGSALVQAQGFGPMQAVDASVAHVGDVGDSFWGDIRRPFTQAGMWGILRVCAHGQCSGLRELGKAGGPPGPAPPQPPPPGKQLKNLKVAKRVSIRKLATKGLTFQLTGPAATRALKVQLLRVSGKRQRKVGGGFVEVKTKKQLAKAKRQKLIISQMTITKKGLMRALWKPTQREIKLLRTGKHILVVQAGATRKRIQLEQIKANVTLTKPLPAKAAKKKVAKKAAKTAKATTAGSPAPSRAR
jgi:manganese oxidase